ncbi:MAG: energy-coupling factor transporter transmembrane component T [Clostridiales bacterium]|nr:energy-coupling factor transporter transmembrane component T [Clostridiales bacterium]
MLKDITLGQYFPGNSILHRSDPRIKLILVFVFMILIFLIDTYYTFAAMLCFVLLAVILSAIPVRHTLKGLKPILSLIIFVAVFNAFSIPGKVLLQLGPLSLTVEGLEMSLKMVMRLTLLMVSSSLLTLTTTPIALTDGIEKLMGPLKKIGVPAHEIAMMMTIALRFIPTLLEETDKIMKAQASRGADFDSGNIISRAKSFIPVLIPLFVSAFRRADELALAMEARCYRGSEGRTRMKQLRMGKIDAVLLIAMTLFTALLIYLKYFI